MIDIQSCIFKTQKIMIINKNSYLQRDSAMNPWTLHLSDSMALAQKIMVEVLHTIIRVKAR